MANPSPAFQLSTDGVTWGAPGAKIAVSGSATLYARLASTAGVQSVQWVVSSTDETTPPGTYANQPVPVGLPGPTAVVTLTTQGAGTCGILQCTINGGVVGVVGNNSNINYALTRTTAKWYVSPEIGAVGENMESDPVNGFAAWLNPAVRAYALLAAPSVAPTPSLVLLRDTGGQGRCTSFATDIPANVAAGGVYRLPAGNQTAMAAKGASHATVALVSLSNSGATLQLGDGVEITAADFRSASLANLGVSNFVPVTAPSSPVSGWNTFADTADYRLKLQTTTGKQLAVGVGTLLFDQTVTGATIGQDVVTGNGVNVGQSLLMRAQQGQSVGSGSNNNGGPVTVAGGLVGTGGTSGTGLQGAASLQGGGSTASLGLAVSNTTDTTPTTIYTVAVPAGQVVSVDYEIIANLAPLGTNPCIALGVFRRRFVAARVGTASPAISSYTDVTQGQSPNGQYAVGTITNGPFWDGPDNGNSGSFSAAFNGAITHSIAGNSINIVVQGFHSSPPAWVTLNPYLLSVGVSGTANNGSGVIRIHTASAHGLASGAQVQITGVGGTVEANGWWVITIADSTHFDLTGSTYTNAYTSGGTVTIPAAFVTYSSNIYVLTAPGSSGATGPVGTGTGLFDGTCTWAYVGPAASGVPVRWTLAELHQRYG